MCTVLWISRRCGISLKLSEIVKYYSYQILIHYIKCIFCTLSFISSDEFSAKIYCAVIFLPLNGDKKFMGSVTPIFFIEIYFVCDEVPEMVKLLFFGVPRT